jgi:hypothetical protein
MRAPDPPELGQGSRRRCVTCRQPLNIPGRGRFKGRARKYCSRHCADEAHRQLDPRPVEITHQRASNPVLDFCCGKGGKNHQTNQLPAKARFEPTDRGSAFKPILQQIAGPPVSIANLIIPLNGLPPKRIPPDERAELIRRAREVEFEVRWSTHGLKPNGGRR